MAEPATRTVEAEINYLAADSFVNRRFVAPGVEHNTGRFEPHRVVVRDARPIADRFKLDEHGFQLFAHRSAVTDFFDKGQVDTLYPEEIRRLVEEITGADQVILRGWLIRTSGDIEKAAEPAEGFKNQGTIQPPACDAHVDWMPDRAERQAATAYEQTFPDGPGYSRFITFSLWRCFSPPPQDWPLAVCESSSVGPDEGVANILHVVDRVPGEAEMLGPIEGEEAKPAAAVFRHNPGHRWWWFSGMTRDEVLVFKFHDSDKSRAWRTPHTAFRDPTVPPGNPRQSIEIRAIAYFA